MLPREIVDAAERCEKSHKLTTIRGEELLVGDIIPSGDQMLLMVEDCGTFGDDGRLFYWVNPDIEDAQSPGSIEVPSKAPMVVLRPKVLPNIEKVVS